MESAKVQIEVRQASDNDLAFIYNTWLDSYIESRLARTMKPTIYRDRQRKLINNILARPTVHTIVASPPDDDLTVLAWAVVESPDIAHYVFTKKNFRRFGLARTLLGTFDGTFRYSHKTDDGDRLCRSFKRVVYDFYAAFPPLTGGA